LAADVAALTEQSSNLQEMLSELMHRHTDAMDANRRRRDDKAQDADDVLPKWWSDGAESPEVVDCVGPKCGTT
jgi:phage terminase Nu1 subunit (DNA packaging protein)